MKLVTPSNTRFKSAIAAASILIVCSSAAGVADEDEKTTQVGPRPVQPTSLQVGQLFPAIQGKGIDGRTFDLASAKSKKATVVALTSTSCPICKKYASTLAAIEKKYQSKGVQFCYLNTLPSDDIGDIKDDIKTHGFQGPYIHDKTEKWNQSLKIRTTAEVFVFDSAMTLVYRGAVDDQYGIVYQLNQPKRKFLDDALNSIVANESVEVSATSAPGCDIWQKSDSNSKPAIDANLTYHNRISRIVQNNCVDCHRKKGLGPFSLETASDLKSHAGMIKTVVENGSMPPWFAAKSEDEKKDNEKLVWANERRLSEEDKKDLLNWLASNREIGDSSDAPKPKMYAEQWNIGKPDKEFRLPRKRKIKATGFMDYQYAMVETEFETDKWISAVEIRPTDPKVVHHVLVLIRRPGQRRDRDELDGFFAAYVPGNSFQIFPKGFAKKIPAGSKLIFQLHYTPNGKATEDQTVMGLKFYDGKPKHRLRVKGIAQKRLSIPARNSNYSREQIHVVGRDAKLMAFMPHMHLRGKKFKYELVDPKTKKSETILDIPKYDFNWQLVYRLAEPFSIKGGSVLKVTGTFDNSEENLANPDPNRTVSWGDQTYDEMLIGYVEYYFPDEKVE